MSESLASTKSPFESHTKVNIQNKDSHFTDKDQIISKLRQQIIEKDLYISQLEQRLNRHQQMLSDTNQQLDKLKLIEQYYVDHNTEFSNYFDRKPKENKKHDPSITQEEDYLSPTNYRQTAKDNLSLSPINRQSKADLKLLKITNPKTKEYITSLLLTSRDELVQSKNSNYTSSTHSNVNSIGSGVKRVSQHLTSKPIQKLVIESHDNPLDDTNLQLKSSTSVQNQKLYEEFFYLGASSQDITQTVQNFIKTHGEHPNNLPTLKTKSSILYRYRRFSANKSIFKNEALFQQELKMKGLGTQMMINQFIFPFGIEIKKLSNQDGDSQINEILFANYPIDNNFNCFVIPVTQNQDENVSSSKSLQKPTKPKDMMNICNRNNTLYYVCVKFNDFLDTNKLHRNEPTQLWSHQRVVCISTKFPFVQFFFELLISFLNDVKLQRIQTYKDNSSLQQVDSDYCIKRYLDQKINEKLSQSLTSIALLAIPSFNTKQSVEFYGQNVILAIPHQELLDRMEVDWAISHMLQNFTSQQIVQIFISLILERSVVFICKQPHILTCAIIVFYKILLQPLQWIHPLITSLPEEYIDLLDSPVPIIAGIIKDPNYIEQIKLYERYTEIIFVIIREKNVDIVNTDAIPSIPVSVSRHFKHKLDPYFQLVMESNQTPKNIRQHERTHSFHSNSNMSKAYRSNTPTQIFKMNKLPDVHSKEVCYKIIEQFQQFVKQGIVQNLPKNPIYIQKRYGDPSMRSLLDYDKIAQQTLSLVIQQYTGSTDFWKQLFRTQIFIYFLDQFYQQN